MRLAVLLNVCNDYLIFFFDLCKKCREYKSDKGLIHMGVDIVELKGEPFLISVKEGEMITCNQIIAEMDSSMIEKKEKDTRIVGFG